MPGPCPGQNQKRMLWWLDGLTLPLPHWSSQHHVGGGLWRAVTCGMRSSFFLFFLFLKIFFTCPQVPSWPFGVDSFFHPWWTSWTNFHLPYALLLYPAWSLTLCLFYIWLCSFPDVLHHLQDLYGVRNNFHHRQSTPEVSPRISHDHELHFRDVLRLMTSDYIEGLKHCCALDLL